MHLAVKNKSKSSLEGNLSSSGSAKLERPDESRKKEVVFHVPIGEGRIVVESPALFLTTGEKWQEEKALDKDI